MSGPTTKELRIRIGDYLVGYSGSDPDAEAAVVIRAEPDGKTFTVIAELLGEAARALGVLLEQFESRTQSVQLMRQLLKEWIAQGRSKALVRDSHDVLKMTEGDDV